MANTRVLAFSFAAVGARGDGGLQRVPRPAEVEKLICEIASHKAVEDIAVEVCTEFNPRCKATLELVWGKVATICNEPAPGPALEIEKYVCEFLYSENIEFPVVEKACSVISEKLPHATFNPDCNTVLEGFWDQAVAVCSEAPTPWDVERLICEHASQRAIEDRDVEGVCAFVFESFPHPRSFDCKAVLESYWDAAVARCPKFGEAPVPSSIEKLICDLLYREEGAEAGALAHVCAVISKEFPRVLFNDCETALERWWDKAMAVCSEAPSPGDVEKMVCEYASQKAVEDRDVEGVCAKIADDFPDLEFFACETVLENLWDVAVARCPRWQAAKELVV